MTYCVTILQAKELSHQDDGSLFLSSNVAFHRPQVRISVQRDGRGKDKPRPLENMGHLLDTWEELLLLDFY